MVLKKNYCLKAKNQIKMTPSLSPPPLGGASEQMNRGSKQNYPRDHPQKNSWEKTYYL